MTKEIIPHTETINKNVDLIILGDNNQISALFKRPQTAENVYADLLRQGYKPDDIDLVMSESTHKKCFSDYTDIEATDLGNKALEGLGVGAVIGGSVGALAAAFAAAGTSLVIPGLGLIVAGSLAASLAGAGAGAAAGGLIGVLIGSETPNEHVKLFEEGLKGGGVVISMKANSHKEREELHKQWSDFQEKESFTQAA
ncbi:MAG: hypothetical protein K2Y18_08860 [Alphaproteobacteria bacterium]|jgi:hypothetical protein|nr:hypothetical protein [Alphaproteobacteria bacterium]